MSSLWPPLSLYLWPLWAPLQGFRPGLIILIHKTEESLAEATAWKLEGAQIFCDCNNPKVNLIPTLREVNQLG